MGDLTHLDEHGEARMVDVSAKAPTRRRAVARGAVLMSPEALSAIADGRVPKGDVLAAARIAGIMAAKKTPELIPLCHGLALASVKIDLTVDKAAGRVRISAEARAQDRTGVEMEALTAVSVAALTIYDMAKALDRGMRIDGIELIEKEGGRSGHWQRSLQVVRKGHGPGDRHPSTPPPAPAEPETSLPVPPAPTRPRTVPPRPMAVPPRPTDTPADVAPPRKSGPSDAARSLATHVRRLPSDDAKLLATLSRDPVVSAYMLGDLDQPYAEHCQWYAVDDGDGAPLRGIMLLYSGLSIPTVLTKGEPAPVEALLAAAGRDLPRRFYGHFRPEHRAPLEAYYELDDVRPMVRMGLERALYQPASPAEEVEPLSHRDTGAIMRLYQHYPDNFFEPAQLSTGMYFGIRDGDELVSVAGIHVLSERHDIAAIGNIVTHSARRGQGLATRCVARLLDALFERVGSVALNVQADNVAAIACYRKFGFTERYPFFEGYAQSR